MHKLTVTTSPHIHSGATTRRIMLDVIIALIPAFIAATIFFGPVVLRLAAVTISAAVLFEWIFCRIMKRDTSSIFDLTAVVTGLIMVLGIPSNTPMWISVVGVGVAIIVVKQLFGGVGRNLFNPALVGHIVVLKLAAYGPDFQPAHPWLAIYGTDYPLAMSWLDFINYPGVYAVTSATPLQLLADGTQLPSLGELFLGIHAGVMGETSILALLLGGCYLVWRRVISPIIPLIFIGTAILFVTLAGQDPLIHLLSGSLVFVAIFMATDYATSPINKKGKVIFAIGCGLITAWIRLYGSTTEGVTMALIIMNLLTPLIEKLTLPKTFGQGKVSRI